MRLTDRDRIREMLSHEPALHIYELGDLDDFFWPYTTWFVRDHAIALLYTATEPPVLLALGDAAALLIEIREQLPSLLYAHLSPGLVDSLAPRFANEPRGQMLKMVLADRAGPAAFDRRRADALGVDDERELAAFYARTYPDNTFDPRMLVTGQYIALRQAGAIVAAAGVHVYSRRERVAALANIAVAPDQRGAGLGREITARACMALLETVDHIGLNVRADNAAAIACYTRLGFVPVAPFEEHLLIER